MLKLQDTDWIGKGMHKSVYGYPGDPYKCVKIPHKIPDVDVKREMFYRKVLGWKGQKMTIIPEYFGMVSTNKGEGYCFECLRNSDGTVCQSLRDYMSGIDPQDKVRIEEIQKTLLGFKEDFLNSIVITSDVDSGNFFVQKKKDRATVRIVDNIGTPVAIPAMYFIKYMAVYHNRRCWKRFCREQRKENPVIFTEEFVRELVKV